MPADRVFLESRNCLAEGFALKIVKHDFLAVHANLLILRSKFPLLRLQVIILKFAIIGLPKLRTTKSYSAPLLGPRVSQVLCLEDFET